MTDPEEMTHEICLGTSKGTLVFQAGLTVYGDDSDPYKIVEEVFPQVNVMWVFELEASK